MKYDPILDPITLHSRVQLGTTSESQTLEFKRQIKFHAANKNKELSKEIARDIAAMANTWGGTILVGVAESQEKSGYSVATEYVDVEEPERLRQWVENKVRGELSPSTIHFSVDLIAARSDSRIVAINIPPLLGGAAAIWRPGSRSIEYPIRTHFGKQYMNPADVEKHIMNQSRLIEIKLHQFMTGQRTAILFSTLILNLETGTERWQRVHAKASRGYDVVGYEARCRYIRHSNSPLKILELNKDFVLMEFDVPDIQAVARQVRVPYSAVRDVWPLDSDRLGLVLEYVIVVPKETEHDAYLDPSFFLTE